MGDDVLTKGERTRQSILDGAYELFMEHGFHAASMRQIADRSGLALGGIYNHFAGKEEIFEAVIFDKHPYKQFLPHILAAEGDTVEEFVHNAARAVVQGLGKRPEFLKLMFIEIVEFNGAHVVKLMNEIAPQVLPIFERLARARRDLRPIHPAVMMRAFLGMFFSFYITEFLIGKSPLAKLMPGNSFELFVDIYLHGVIRHTEPA